MKLSAAYIIKAMMEAANTSETSVNFYQTTRRSNPDNSNLHIRRSENLKSHLVTLLFPKNECAKLAFITRNFQTLLFPISKLIRICVHILE
jgi:hypothetical protein